jgi:hypothetical protein
MTICCSHTHKSLISALVRTTFFLLATALAATAATPVATTTALTISPATVAAGKPVTMTATVTSSGAPLSPGEVLFCNASAPYCVDSALLGSAWLSSTNGTATLRRTIPTGVTSITAVFQGTNSYLSSSSSPQPVTVTGVASTPASANTFPTLGSNAAGIVSADFNNDGYPDLAVTDESGTVQVFLNNGDGTFTAQPSISLYTGGPSGQPVSIAGGDFNADGNADLVVLGHYVLLGNGDGTFNVGTTVSTVAGGFTQVADFNRDGQADIVVFSGDSTFTVLLGNGDGTFIAGPTTSSIGSGQSFAVADFNGDGIPDIVVTGGIGLGVQVLLGKGDGSFAATPAYLTEADPKWVTAGDFNGDGFPDIAVSDPASSTITVLTSPGTGTISQYVNGAMKFTIVPGSALSAQPGEIFAADINGDSKTDLVAGVTRKASSDPTLLLLAGNGDGTFGGVVTDNIVPPSAFFAGAVSFGDFFADGATSIAVLTGESPSYITTLQDLSSGPTVVKTMPVITWATPAAIQNPAPLSSTQLDATASDPVTSATLPGTFVYNPPAGTVLSAGSQTLGATFTPADTSTYSTAEKMVTLTVNPPTGSYTITANPTNITQAGNVALTLVSTYYTGSIFFTTNVTTTATNSNVTVTASAPSVALTSGGTATTTLTVKVSGVAASSRAPQLPWKTGLAGTFGVALLGAPLLRRRHALGVLLALGAICLVAFIASCGGSVSKAAAGSGSPTVYNITVTPIGSGTVNNPSPVTVTLSLN